jgi:flagellin
MTDFLTKSPLGNLGTAFLKQLRSEGAVATPQSSSVTVPQESSPLSAAPSSGSTIEAQLSSEAAIIGQGSQNAASAYAAYSKASDAASALEVVLTKIQDLAETAMNTVTSQTQRDALDSEAQLLVAEYDRILDSRVQPNTNPASLIDGTTANVFVQLGRTTASFTTASLDVGLTQAIVSSDKSIDLSNRIKAETSYSIAANALDELAGGSALFTANENALASTVSRLALTRETTEASASLRAAATADNVASNLKSEIIKNGILAQQAHENLSPLAVLTLLNDSEE